MSGRRLVLIGAALAAAGAAGAAACVDNPTAPGHCPDYCPSGQIVIVDTVLVQNVARDTAFRGYVTSLQSPLMLVADLPGFVDSRSIFRINGVGSRRSISTTDTSTGPILGADSARLQIVVARRDTGAHNLTLHLYRLPKTIDTTTTFADLAGPFTDSLVRTLNIDTLLARIGRKDTITGDSVVVDTVNHTLTLSLKLDTAAARYIPDDSGTVAYGVRVSADARASIALTGAGLTLHWWVRVDSLNVPVPRTLPVLGAAFWNFVFDPPAPPLDSTLEVGGVPSARSFLRVAFPRYIRDSSQVIRGTLVLLPAAPVGGAPVDSFVMEASSVLADFGAKSPLDLRLRDTTVIHTGVTDTVTVEVTNLLQLWAADSTHPTTIVLRPRNEAQSLATARFYPSVAAAFRPFLRITYVRRFPFGQP